ncbi:MAG: hypothetical protein OHK0056_06510 [Bacteriovoracaceae bacterium]
MKRCICLLTLFTMSPSFAGDLKAPVGLPSAKVLPKGVRNLTYKNVAADAENKYNSSGESLVIADPFFKEITFKDAIRGKIDPVDQGAFEQAMLSIGATETDSFGQTTGQVNIKANVHVPIFAWGVTKRLTLAAAFPIIQSSTNVDTGVVHSNPSLHQQMKAALEAKGVSSKVAEFDNKMNDPIRAKLEEYNYEPLKNESTTKMGDIKLIAKFMGHEDDYNRIVLSTDVTLPTGKDQDVNKVVDVASGDDQWDIGAGIGYDRVLNEDFTWANELSYVVQLPDQNPERIPLFDDSKVTPDIDYNTQRDLGDIAIATTSLKFRKFGWSLGSGYSFQYKGADRYSGTAYSSERYKYLEQDTRQNMHSAIISGGFDTLDLFRSKRFPVPIILSITHTWVLSGKNVINDPLTTLDFSMFF